MSQDKNKEHDDDVVLSDDSESASFGDSPIKPSYLSFEKMSVSGRKRKGPASAVSHHSPRRLIIHMLRPLYVDAPLRASSMHMLMHPFEYHLNAPLSAPLRAPSQCTS
jgi:hypothetical protein